MEHSANPTVQKNTEGWSSQTAEPMIKKSGDQQFQSSSIGRDQSLSGDDSLQPPVETNNQDQKPLSDSSYSSWPSSQAAAQDSNLLGMHDSSRLNKGQDSFGSAEQSSLGSGAPRLHEQQKLGDQKFDSQQSGSQYQPGQFQSSGQYQSGQQFQADQGQFQSSDSQSQTELSTTEKIKDAAGKAGAFIKDVSHNVYEGAKDAAHQIKEGFSSKKSEEQQDRKPEDVRLHRQVADNTAFRASHDPQLRHTEGISLGSDNSSTEEQSFRPNAQQPADQTAGSTFRSSNI